MTNRRNRQPASSSAVWAAVSFPKTPSTLWPIGTRRMLSVPAPCPRNKSDFSVGFLILNAVSPVPFLISLKHNNGLHLDAYRGSGALFQKQVLQAHLSTKSSCHGSDGSGVGNLDVCKGVASSGSCTEAPGASLFSRRLLTLWPPSFSLFC